MANEGYIPYGLDRASRSMDEILDARSRMAQANIRKSLVRGQEQQGAIQDAFSDAAKLHVAASDRWADAATLATQKKARLVRAKSENRALTATIDKLQKMADQNPPNRMEIELQISKLEARRGMWQAVIESYDQQELAKILNEQAKYDLEMKQAEAADAEAAAASSRVSRRLNKRTPLDEIGFAFGEEESFDISDAMDNLKVNTQDVDLGSGLRSMDIRSEILNPVGPLSGGVGTPLDATVDLTMDLDRRGGNAADMRMRHNWYNRKPPHAKDFFHVANLIREGE